MKLIVAEPIDLHERGTMCRVLAMEHQESVLTRRGLEETLGKLLLVTKVQSTFNVPTVVFILETAVNNHLVVIQVVVNTIEHVNQGLTGDARKALWFASSEMRKFEWVDIINIHYRLKTAGLIVLLLLFGIHHIYGALEHAQRTSEFAWPTRWGASRFPDGGKGRSI